MKDDYDMNICKFGLSLSLISGHSRPAFELAHYLTKRGVNVKILSSKLDEKRSLIHQNLLKSEKLSVEEKRFVGSITDFMIHPRDKAIKEILSWADIIHVYGIHSLLLLHKYAPFRAKIVLSVNTKFKLCLRDFTHSGRLSYKNLTKLPYLARMLPNKYFVRTLSMADDIICWTKFMQKEVMSLGTFNPTWIPVGINMERVQVEANTIDGNFIFLYLGYLASARGVVDLLSAFEIVNRKWPSTKLILSHTGMHPSEQDVILKKIQKSKSKNAIEIAGFFTDISDIINRANAVVLPFRTMLGYSQPPLTVLEALAHGRPVITTQVGCLPELITEGINGFCIPPKDPRMLARLMFKMREVDLDFMSANAREYVLSNHDWQKISKSTIQLYNKLLLAGK